MPHIELPTDAPGIRGLMAFKPKWGEQLSALAQTILRGSSSLSSGERELIAAFVSNRNECRYCTRSHAAVARELLDDPSILDAVIDDYESAPIDERLRSLLRIAADVQQQGNHVSEDAIAIARSSGASDEDIHDTVLVAAAFCMFNRYVDGLAAFTPDDPNMYKMVGRMLASDGYVLAAGS